MRTLTIVSSVLLLAACGGDGGGGGGADAGRDQDAAAEADAGGPAEITLRTWSGAVMAPAPLVASVVEDGAWQVLASDDGSYSFEVDGTRYGVAVVCVNPSDEPIVTLLFATVEETRELNAICENGPAAASGTVTTTVSSLTATAEARVVVGGSSQTATQGDPVTSHNARVGTRDVLAVIDPDGGPDFTHIVSERGVTVAEGQDTEVALNAQDAASLVSFEIAQVGPTEAEMTALAVFLFTGNGTRALLQQDLTGEVTQFRAAPVAALADGDLHFARLTASDAAARTSRQIARWYHEPQNQTLTLRDARVEAALAFPISEPYLRPAVTFDAYPAAQVYQGELLQEGVPTRVVTWHATVGWLGDATEYTWTMPDLSGLDGWDESWGLSVDATLWSVAATRTSADIQELLPRAPGAVSELAEWDGRLDERSSRSGVAVP